MHPNPSPTAGASADFRPLAERRQHIKRLQSATDLSTDISARSRVCSIDGTPVVFRASPCTAALRHLAPESRWPAVPASLKKPGSDLGNPYRSYKSQVQRPPRPGPPPMPATNCRAGRPLLTHPSRKPSGECPGRSRRQDNTLKDVKARSHISGSSTAASAPRTACTSVSPVPQYSPPSQNAQGVEQHHPRILTSKTTSVAACWRRPGHASRRSI